MADVPGGGNCMMHVRMYMLRAIELRLGRGCMTGWGSHRSMMSFSNEQLTPHVSGIVDNGHGTGVLCA